MPHVFTVERGPRPGLQLIIGKTGRMRIGRSASADLVLPAEDRRIAPLHAELDVQHGVITFRPFVEAGPSRVNGKLITSPTRLKVGDLVQVGETHLLLGSTEEEPPESVVRLSMSDIVESVKSRRLESQDVPRSIVETPPPKPGESNRVMVTGAVFVEAERESLFCTDCGKKGITPPRPDLWDAAWICSQCAQAKRVSSPRIPTRIGNFDVIRPLARGGMGVVYEGVARDSGLHVAIKVMNRSRDTTERNVQRFVREQHITKTLRHPNIVCCYDVGTWEDALYIVYEFVAGGDALSVSSPSSPLQEVLWLGADLFRALGYGHDLGIVHRDVKPANVLLARTGPTGTLRAKLADFGLAKSYADLAGQPITMSNESGGSLLTIGPEQLLDFMNMPLHGDLYAGAATVFWILTGDTPLVLPVPTDKASFEQKVQAILDKRRKVLRDLRPDVPETVATLIDGLVAHDASTRASMHAREVAVALNAIASRLAKRPAAQPATVTRIVQAGERPSSPQTPVPVRTKGEATMQSVATPERHFKEAMDALERCIRMLERSVERAAIEVREAAQTDDAKRIERVVAGHEQAQADLEAALARWEQILAGASH